MTNKQKIKKILDKHLGIATSNKSKTTVWRVYPESLIKDIQSLLEEERKISMKYKKDLIMSQKNLKTLAEKFMPIAGQFVPHLERVILHCDETLNNLTQGKEAERERD